MRQRKLTDQQRIDAVTAYLAGAGSYQAVAEQFQISSRTLRDLVALYQYHGPDALKSSVTNNTYPPELKRQAVEEYQSGQGTQRDICLKYNIRARTQLRNWIRQYGSGDLSSAAPPRANPRKKKTIPGRKTTLDERINIVSHCLANDIVAFNISPSNNNNLVFTTFDRAIEKYPDAHPLVHSDRGFQYTNLKFKIKLRKQGMLQSMSRAGMCVDNAPMEAFWGTLKSEMYHLDQFDDYDTLAQAICDYIHFYNTRRRQRRLDKLPPLAYRAQQALLSESGES